MGEIERTKDMKVGFFNRLIFVLAALIILGASLLLMIFTWRMEFLFSFGDISDTVTTVVDNLYHANINFIPATIGIFFGLVITVWLLVLAFKRNKVEKAKAVEYLKIGTPENGQIKIAAATINNLICKNVNEITGVKDSRAKTNLVEEKTYVVVGVSVEDGVVIPKVCEEIQTTTKEKIQQLTGMEIEEINILVNNKA